MSRYAQKRPREIPQTQNPKSRILMTRLLISRYYAEVEKIKRFGGSKNETSIRNAFERLLNAYCNQYGFVLVPELGIKTSDGTTVYPDGTVKDAIRLDHGWWESKDEYDDLDREIQVKLDKGYPTENILFEDSRIAVLIQNAREVCRSQFQDDQGLDALISTFVSYERAEVRTFRDAIDKFKDDLPTILESLRAIVQNQDPANREFVEQRDKLLKVARDSINPEITIQDIHEIIIQHILTEDIFTNIFHDAQFHRDNNIAKAISDITETFFTGALKKNTLRSIEHYYAIIRRCSENIANHHEKQKFLKAVYENFYKAYNPHAADKLGIIYTPNEIVSFMIETVDILLFKHFGKLLSDSGVEILDPCTGTGTFVTELIEHIPEEHIEAKYESEIHCNEVAILPYYIANLNIEFTYQQKMGMYKEFKNICLVDTLDHCGFAGKQHDIFSMSVQNSDRIDKQNDKKISVIIGNPPYYANQANENDNNSARAYPAVDKLIQQSYVRLSSARKTKRYDMYSRFFRWATDRLSSSGILAFITNSNFITSSEADGFRKAVADEFSDIYIIDLGGDIRANPKLSGTKHNVFGIQTGVAISFLIKREQKVSPCTILYAGLPEDMEALDKLSFLARTPFDRVPFARIVPTNDGSWINQKSTRYNSLVEIANSGTKSAKKREDETAVFKLYAMGISTNRDEWVTDLNQQNLKAKMRFFVDQYSQAVMGDRDFVPTIKWSRNLKRKLKAGKMEDFADAKIIPYRYRPYIDKYLYSSDLYVDEAGAIMGFFSEQADSRNPIICITSHKQVPFAVQAVDTLFDAGIGSRGTYGIALYRYDSKGKKVSNITDIGLEMFCSHYEKSDISREAIFAYVFAVLNYPTYQNEFAKELQISFPRIPLYEDFAIWAEWGQKLIELQLDFKSVEPYPLSISIDPHVKNELPKLAVDKENGCIYLDSKTTLYGVPDLAWRYKIANKSVIEWIFDQYKHKKPKDPTIANKFDTYSYARDKDGLIGLICRITAVSVDIVRIIDLMLARGSA
jgi:predicted helicase